MNNVGGEDEMVKSSNPKNAAAQAVAFLEVLDAAGVVLNATNEVISQSTQAEAMGLVEYEKLTNQQLQDLVNQARSEKGAKIQASPVTGRMHQIRIHASDSQVPILGDALYYRIDRKAPRLMLHAQTLKFQHPKTGKDMIIEAPLWDDFLKVERNLLGASNENAID